MNELTRIANPFRNFVVKDPWNPSEIDVPEINRDAFLLCLEAVDGVRRNHQTSILLHGETGSGKTHLLARLRSSLAASQPPGTGEIHDIVFVSVQMHTGPRMIWRRLRSSFVTDLLRKSGGDNSQLERILLWRLSEYLPKGIDLPSWLETIRQSPVNYRDHLRELVELFDELDQDARLGHSLCVVLSHLLLARHRVEAASWLRGESLPDDSLKLIDLTTEPADNEESENTAAEIVLALCNLAGPKIPVLFCFDQIEAMQARPSDTDGFFAFGQLIARLHDQTSNTLMISCIQSSMMEQFRQAIRDADWARLTSGGENALKRLNWRETVKLIKARLDSSPELAVLRNLNPNTIWPLDADEVKSALLTKGFSSDACSARSALSVCAEQFEAKKKDIIRPVITEVETRPSLDEFFEYAWQERLEKSLDENSAWKTDQILSHGLPLLIYTMGLPWNQLQEPNSGDIDLLFTHADGATGFIFCNHGNMTSLAGKLRRLLNYLPMTGPQRLVLLRDARFPISRSARTTRQYLDELTSGNAVLIRPAGEALAALDALRTLISDAKSGDLTNHTEIVPPETLQEWLKTNLPVELKDFLDDISSAGSTHPGGESAFIDAITEILERFHIISVDDIAKMLEKSPEEIEMTAQRHPELFGLLSNPPAVLFQLVLEKSAI